MLRIGLISDTHGLLRPEALAALRGVDHLIHGGDIGSAAVLAALGDLAPVTAVRGNNDRDGWNALPHDALLRFESVLAYVIHDANELRRRALPPSVRVVVSGHSHRPSIAERDGVLWVNPGSAGPRRFRLPVAVGELLVDGAGVSARLVELAVHTGAQR